MSVTTAPGAKLSATIARFCPALQRRRRSGPVITSTLAIAPSLTPVQTPSLAPMLATARTGAAAQGGPHRSVTFWPYNLPVLFERNVHRPTPFGVDDLDSLWHINFV